MIKLITMILGGFLFSILMNLLSPMEVTGLLLLGLLIIRVDNRRRGIYAN